MKKALIITLAGITMFLAVGLYRFTASPTPACYVADAAGQIRKEWSTVLCSQLIEARSAQDRIRDFDVYKRRVLVTRQGPASEAAINAFHAEVDKEKSNW